MVELGRAILTSDVPNPRALRPEVDSRLVPVVRKALEKDPDYRCWTAEELANDLDAFLEDRPLSASRIAGIPAYLRRRRKTLVRGAGAVGLLVLSGVAVWAAVVHSVQPPASPTPPPTATAPETSRALAEGAPGSHIHLADDRP